MKLTEHLLSLDTNYFKDATEHGFLKQVGQHDIKPENLKAWIIQARYCTGGYAKMLGEIVPRLALFEDQCKFSGNDQSDSLQENLGILKTISFAFSKVCRDTKLFSETLNKPCYDMEQSVGQNSATVTYLGFERKIMEKLSSDLGQVLVLIWAMEKIFFTAWNYAKSISSDQKFDAKDLHIQSCRALMDNWSTPEYKEFVEECALHVDQLSTDDPSHLHSFELAYKTRIRLQSDNWENAYC